MHVCALTGKQPLHSFSSSCSRATSVQHPATTKGRTGRVQLYRTFKQRFSSKPINSTAQKQKKTRNDTPTTDKYNRRCTTDGFMIQTIKNRLSGAEQQHANTETTPTRPNLSHPLEPERRKILKEKSQKIAGTNDKTKPRTKNMSYPIRRAEKPKSSAWMIIQNQF